MLQCVLPLTVWIHMMGIIPLPLYIFFLNGAGGRSPPSPPKSDTQNVGPWCIQSCSTVPAIVVRRESHKLRDEFTTSSNATIDHSWFDDSRPVVHRREKNQCRNYRYPLPLGSVVWLGELKSVPLSAFTKTTGSGPRLWGPSRAWRHLPSWYAELISVNHRILQSRRLYYQTTRHYLHRNSPRS